MRKLIAVVVLVGGLLAGAGTATAQYQGGLGDPLTLATSGVLIPYLTSAGRSALVEVASPYHDNFNMHLIFFNNTCTKVGDIGLPESTNDIGFVNPTQNGQVQNGVDGLVAIGRVTASSSRLDPLENPIHSRVYEFSGVDGRSLILEPIVIDTFELRGGLSKTWSPLRTAATFFAPPENGITATRLLHVCPRNTIQDGATTNLGVFPIFFGSNFVFPAINPPFVAGPTQLGGFVYDVNEFQLSSVSVNCDCLTDVSVKDFNGGGGAVIYNLPADALSGSLGATLGTYTELNVVDPNPATGFTQGSFTGYRNAFTVGSITNYFFGRLSNTNRAHIAGSEGNPFNLHSGTLNSNLKSTDFPFAPTLR